jgi:hypothetical protein
VDRVPEVPEGLPSQHGADIAGVVGPLAQLSQESQGLPFDVMAGGFPK